MIHKIETDNDVLQSIEPSVLELLKRANEGAEITINKSIFKRLQVPSSNRETGNSRCVNFLNETKEQSEFRLAMDLLGVCEMRNATMFNRGNIMHWHTNSDYPGERLYYIYNEEPGSLFAWQNPETKEVHYEEEGKGWSAKRFMIPDSNEALLWHAIWAKGRRASIGFLVNKKEQ